MDTHLLQIIQLEAPVDYRIQQASNLQHRYLNRLSELRQALEREGAAFPEDMRQPVMHDIELYTSYLEDIADVLSGLQRERSVKQLEMIFD